MDKLKHFAVALGLMLVMGLVTPLGMACAAVGIVVVGYEAYQLYTGSGVFEWLDIVAGFAGIILATVCLVVLGRQNERR